MAKTPKIHAAPAAVRTRRAYFDFKHGQLHVRTAFPTTGGFDEQVTLFCLHGAEGTSRTFARLLPVIADVRSVYAPDLPGCGESDAAAGAAVPGAPADSPLGESAAAVADLAADLRLRQIDLLGVHSGAAVALELAAARPELVRRLVLVGPPAADRLREVKQPALIIRTRLEAAESLSGIKAVVPNGKIVELFDVGHDLFETAPPALVKQVVSFLGGRG